jgi:hypothetical protein
MMVYDESGRLLLQQNAKINAGENSILVQTKQLAQGVYYLHISSPEGRKCLQFVIVR